MIRLRPPPRNDEVFASWVQRVAAINGLEVKSFVNALRERYAEHLSAKGYYLRKNQLLYVNPDSVEHEQLVVLMAAATGLTKDFLQTLILRSKTHWYALKLLTPVGRLGPRKYRHQAADTAWHPDSYCPNCLAEHFSLRRLWRPGFPCVCREHQIVLMDRCPDCHATLKFYDARTCRRLYGRRAADLRCWRCNLDLTSIPQQVIDPQHGSIIELLSLLFEGPPQVRYTDWRTQILNIFHWWMDAYFQTCTTLVSPPSFLTNVPQLHRRVAYLYQPSRERYTLFKAVCEAVGRVRLDKRPVNEEDNRCKEWMGTYRWSVFCSVGWRVRQWLFA